jgi:c-di-AMP phosphodiesterase-like protein
MIHFTNEALLTQLGYSVNEATLAQMDRIVKNTKGFEHLQKHIISLNDALKPHKAYIALSNSHDFFKIKNEAKSAEIVKEVDEMIHKWAEKYKVKLKKVDKKETYYIVGSH